MQWAGNRREKILRFSSFYHHLQQGSLLCYFSYWLKFSRGCASSELKGILLLLLWAQKAPYVLRYYNGNNRKNSSDFLFIYFNGDVYRTECTKEALLFPHKITSIILIQQLHVGSSRRTT